MNNTERELWLLNDEGLYRWWKSSGLSNREFIREHRDEIDAAIASVVNAKPTNREYTPYTGA